MMDKHKGYFFLLLGALLLTGGIVGANVVGGDDGGGFWVLDVAGVLLGLSGLEDLGH